MIWMFPPFYWCFADFVVDMVYQWLWYQIMLKLSRLLASKEVSGILLARKVLIYLSNNRSFIWNEPLGGGFWEHMVQSVKRCLRKSVGRSTLCWSTWYLTCENQGNSQLPCPEICVFGVSYALSPSHLLHGLHFTTTTTSNSTHYVIGSAYTTVWYFITKYKNLCLIIFCQWVFGIRNIAELAWALFNETEYEINHCSGQCC